MKIQNFSLIVFFLFLLSPVMAQNELTRQVTIDLNRQLITVTQDSKTLFSEPCSSGRPTLPTPTGATMVIDKDRNGYSKTFDSPMPWFVELGFLDSRGNSRKIGVHEGDLPEYPVSHACIRLAKGSAEKFFRLVDKGTPVFVKGDGREKLRDFDGFKLLDYDDNGKLLGFRRGPNGELTEEFLTYVRTGSMRICSVKKDGKVAKPPLQDRSTWYMAFEFMDTPGKQGVSVLEYEKVSGRIVNFTFKKPPPR